uniref:Secreted protein n=1 Tax=Steinernema glaseri TaxID=37863 RepID=A0A1I8AU94_9BILA
MDVEWQVPNLRLFVILTAITIPPHPARSFSFSFEPVPDRDARASGSVAANGKPRLRRPRRLLRHRRVLQILLQGVRMPLREQLQRRHGEPLRMSPRRPQDDHVDHAHLLLHSPPLLFESRRVLRVPRLPLLLLP